jgi:hypothetical protein
MHVVIWRYRVVPADRAKFVKAYGPEAAYTRLDRRLEALTLSGRRVVACGHA